MSFGGYVNEEIPKMIKKIGTKIVLHYFKIFFLPSVNVQNQLGRQEKKKVAPVHMKTSCHNVLCRLQIYTFSKSPNDTINGIYHPFSIELQTI